MRSEQEADRAVEKYSDMIKRICMVKLKSYADTEDIFQDVFMKYILSSNAFESDEHEKAWFIRVTINCCKDYLKSFFRTHTVPLEIIAEHTTELSDEKTEVLEAVLSLPKKYKDAIYLFYYEGYSAVEISELLGKKVNTVYTLLSRGRDFLKEKLGGEGFG